MKRAVLAFVLAALAGPDPAGADPLPLSRVTTGPSGGNEDVETSLLASSADGSRAIFATGEALTADDHRPGFDWYERVGDTTRLLAQDTGTDDPRIGMGFFGASADATRIVFSGGGRWTLDDTDNFFTADVYTAKDRVVRRVSTGPAGGNADYFDARPVAMSGDGNRIVFETAENLTTDDTDYATKDVYLHEGGVTTRLSTGPAGGNADGYDAEVVGQSDDARRIVIRTPERLTADDTDTRFDLYVRAAGQTIKVSPGNGPHDVAFDGISADGATAVFDTTERLTADDKDDRADVYRVSGGSLARVSTGPLGGNDPGGIVGDDPSGYGGDVAFVSRDGTRVAFHTYEHLTGDDTDEQLDAYLWTPAGVEKVTPGNGNVGDGWELGASLQGASDDASHLVFQTRERLTADDTDGKIDLYERAGGVVRRVTTGPSGGNGPVEAICLPPPLEDEPCGRLAYVSADGARIVFESDERLVPADQDDTRDVYQRAGGVTTLLSPARPERQPVYGERDLDVFYVDGSLDGATDYLESEEQLTPDDVNLRPDGFRVLPPAPGVVVPGAGGTDPGAGGSTPGGSTSAGGTPSGGGAVPGGTTSVTRTLSAARVRLRSHPRSLRTVSGRTRLAAGGRGIALTFSRAKGLRVQAERALAGRRDGAACRAPSPRLRSAPRCTRIVTVGRPVRLKVTRARAVLRLGAGLRPGRYRLTLTPLDRAGIPGLPVRVTIRLHR